MRVTTNEKLAIFIISWTAQHEKANDIEKALSDEFPETRVIYSDQDDRFRVENERWLRVGNSNFFSRKFELAIRKFDANIFLFITADSQCSDWPGLVRSCVEAFGQNTAIGVWSPTIDHSPFSIERFSLGEVEGSSFQKVFQTDSIVWALSAPVVGRMRQFDYSKNIYGWGICGAACMFCHANGLHVLMDRSVQVSHPEGSAYSRTTAERQMNEFLRQLLPDETLIRKKFYSELSKREARISGRWKLLSVFQSLRERLRARSTGH